MDHWMLYTLHLLLRCVDRLVHTMVLLFLRVTAPLEADPAKQVSHVNKKLAPYVGRLMRKGRTSFQPPGERGSLWKISHVNGTGYRLLLKNFKYETVMPGQGKSTGRYQTAWDGFRDIFDMINQPEKQSHYKARVVITDWFESVTSDYLAHVKTVRATRLPRRRW